MRKIDCYCYWGIVIEASYVLKNEIYRWKKLYRAYKYFRSIIFNRVDITNENMEKLEI